MKIVAKLIEPIITSKEKKIGAEIVREIIIINIKFTILEMPYFPVYFVLFPRL